MSCMEHVCHVCGCQWFNNNAGGSCPDCESVVVSHYFDEALGEQEDENDEDEDEDDSGDWDADDDDDWDDDEDDEDHDEEDEDWEEEDADTASRRYY